MEAELEVTIGGLEGRARETGLAVGTHAHLVKPCVCVCDAVIMGFILRVMFVEAACCRCSLNRHD